MTARRNLGRMRQAMWLVALGCVGCAEGDGVAGGEPTWRAEHVFTVGSLEGPDAFGRIQSILADGEGRLYVADPQANAIAVFDSTGDRVGTIGRDGRGPGEFTRLQSMAWLGDTLAVMDAGNARIGLLSRNGAWLGQFNHQPMTGPALWIRFHRASRSDAWMMAVDAENPGASRVWVRLTSSGPADTVPTPSPEPGMPRSQVSCRGSNSISFFSVPFVARAFFTFTRDGAVVRGRTDAYALATVSQEGDTLTVLSGSAAAVPILDAEWDSASADWHRFREAAPGAECDGDYRRPDHKPVFRFAFLDADGRFWVERYAPDGFTWDVWDGETRVGSLAAPHRDGNFEPYVRDDRMYLITEDSLGVDRVAVYRIVR